MKSLKDILYEESLRESPILESQTISKLGQAVKNVKSMNGLKKAIKKFYNIDDIDVENLFYIVNSDDHVLSDDLKDLIDRLQKKGDIPNKILYRGCSKQEYNTILKTGKSPVNTLSFSENIDLAKKFGDKLIKVTVDVPMFCYHDFLRVYFNKLRVVDSEEFEMVDGDYLIETADEESEWICTNDYTFIKDGDIFKLTK